MSLPRGTQQYTLGSAPVIGNGISWDETELGIAISNHVTDLVFDVQGNQAIATLLESIPSTNFSSDIISQILNNNSRPPEDWRVGEAIAEAYLMNHRGCLFPWPDSRDERRSGSSLPGADLVGFWINGGEILFAFGEVKTSTQAQYPPRVLLGRSGLQRQLEELRDIQTLRHDLFIYLAHRAANASWHSHFIAASQQYLNNSSNVRIFGLLVRDVEPNQNDLTNRVVNLRQNCPEGMVIELISVYLPEGSISSLPARVVANRNGENA